MNKEDLIKHINERISSYFLKDTEKDLWVNERDVVTGGGVMVVNGKQMQQPGQQHHIKSIIEVVGDGDMSKEGFIMIDFSIQEDDTPVQPIGPTECIYYDEFDYFDQLVNKIFGV